MSRNNLFPWILAAGALALLYGPRSAAASNGAGNGNGNGNGGAVVDAGVGVNRAGPLCKYRGILPPMYRTGGGLNPLNGNPPAGATGWSIPEEWYPGMGQ